MTRDSLLKLISLLIGFNTFFVIIGFIWPDWSFHFLVVSLLAIGVWIIWQKPFSQSGYSGLYDNSSASVILLIFFLYGAWIVLAPMIAQQEELDGPCSVRTVERRCYTFNVSNCRTVWNHYEQECNEEIRKKIYEKNPSALVGPAMRRCTYQRLDKAFQSTRRTTNDPICLEHFQKMDSP
jgi:hypothetical protein